MEDLSIEAYRYLKSLLPGQVGEISAWKPGKLPYFLEDAFKLSELSIHDQRVVMAAAREPIPPLSLRKMLERIRRTAGPRVLYVTHQMTAYERKRLLAERLEFVVPGSQLYAPSLMVDLREIHSNSAPHTEVVQLGPASQATLIWLLLKKSASKAVAAITTDLAYSAMTASRATRELESAGLIEVKRDKLRQILSLSGSREEVWERAKPLMRTPVVKTVHIEIPRSPDHTHLKIAGETALADQTMLVPPTHPVFAIRRSYWKREGDQFSVVPEPDRHIGTLQIWAYSPALGRSPDKVDPLSLILSLQHEPSERVQLALDALENETWERFRD